MADEVDRVVKRKRVVLPGGATVDVPVIVEISFLDRSDQSQENRSFLDNSGGAHRTTRVAWLKGNGQGSTEDIGGDTPSDVLPVERIDVLRTVDASSQSQEIDLYPDSKTVAQPSDAPPYFTTHQKTHVVRYINTPDDGNWIESELIDEIRFSDTSSQAQESFYLLTNPPDGNVSGLTLGNDGAGHTTVAVDPGIADITDSTNGVDPPWRTDPFQNLVDFSGGYLILFQFTWADWWYPSYPDSYYRATGGVVPGDPGTTAVAGTDVEMHSQADVSIEMTAPDDPTSGESVPQLIYNSGTITGAATPIHGIEHVGTCNAWEAVLTVAGTNVAWVPGECFTGPGPHPPGSGTRNFGPATDSFNYSKAFVFRVNSLPARFSLIIGGASSTSTSAGGVDTGMNSNKNLGSYTTTPPGPYQPGVAVAVNSPRWNATVFPASGYHLSESSDPLDPIFPNDPDNPVPTYSTTTAPTGNYQAAPPGGVVQLVYEDGSYENKIDRYATELNPDVKTPIVWPVSPAQQIVGGLPFGEYEFNVADSSAGPSFGNPMGTEPS